MSPPATDGQRNVDNTWVDISGVGNQNQEADEPTNDGWGSLSILIMNGNDNLDHSAHEASGGSGARPAQNQEDATIGLDECISPLTPINGNGDPPLPTTAGGNQNEKSTSLLSLEPGTWSFPTTNGATAQTSTAVNGDQDQPSSTAESTNLPQSTLPLPTVTVTGTVFAPSLSNEDVGAGLERERPLIDLDEACLPLAGSNGGANGARGVGVGFVEDWDGAWRREEEADVVRLPISRG